MAKAPEIQLLKRFRAELKLTREQIKELTQQRDALVTAITGLEAVLRTRGVNPDPTEEDEAAEVTATHKHKALPAEVRAAVGLLEESRQSIGAKDIQRALLAKGIATNYYTLYRKLTMEADKEDGVVVRVGEKFGLRELPTNGTGTDR